MKTINKAGNIAGARGARAGLAVLLAGVACIIAPSAQAQTAASGPEQSDETTSGQLEEITVVAQRRDENLQSVPVTVSAFSGEKLANLAIQDVEEIGALTPGLVFTSTVGYALPYLRGVGASSTGPGFENPVATYVDGVYMAAQSNAMMALSNIAAIEVDKGPQGTLFGRNATAGAIQVRTLDPSQEFGGKLSASYGNYNTVTGNLYLTTGLAGDMAGDISVYYKDQGDGYGKNLATGNDFSKSRDIAVRAKVAGDLSPTTHVTLIADYSKSEDKPALLPAPGTRPPGNRAPAANPRDGYGVGDPFMRSEQWGVSVRWDQKLGTLNLMSISSYRQTDFHAYFLNTLTDDVSANNNIETIEPHEQWSQEIQLQSAKGVFEWIVGGYYFHERAGFLEPTMLRGGLAGGGTGINSLPDAFTDSYAAFGQATWAITPTTKLTGGLRYTSEDKSITAVTVLRAATPTPTTLPPLVQADNFSKLTWRAAITQDLGDATLFASYNRGFKSGGFNSAVSQSYSPEVLDAYEAGIKSTLFDRHLRLNVAGFYYDYSNIQVTSFVAGRQTVNNGGTAEIYGLDVDFEAALTGGLTVFGGLEWLHAKFTDYKNAPISVPNPNGGTSFPQGDATGFDLPRAPDITFNAGASYVQDVSFGKITASGFWSYNDGWAAQADNRLRQPSYQTVNLTLGAELHNGLGLTLWAKNLTDERYAVALGARGAGDFIQYADPRTYGATASFKF